MQTLFAMFQTRWARLRLAASILVAAIGFMFATPAAGAAAAELERTRFAAGRDPGGSS